MDNNWGQTDNYAGSTWGLGTPPAKTPLAAAPDPTNGLANNPTYQALTNTERNAYQVANATLGTWGLESLAPDLLKFIQQGYSGDSITYLLSQTKAYKQRFAGNDIRIKNGLAPLSAADYLNTERSYRQVLSASGLPISFYNSPNDYAGLIGSDISPQELQTRSSEAFRYVNTELDPGVLQAWQDYYGVDKAHLAAHFLDPNAAQASLDRQSNAVDIASAAAQQGLDQPGQSRAEHFADIGVTSADAAKGYQGVGSVLDPTQQEANRFGGQYDQSTAEDEYLGGLASAQRKRLALNSQEQALWAGTSPNNGPNLQGNTGGAW